MISKELLELTCKLMSRAVEVSVKSEADIFVNYLAHVTTVEVRIFRTGWKVNESEDINFRIDLKHEYSNDIDKIEQLETALDEINKLE